MDIDKAKKGYGSEAVASIVIRIHPSIRSWIKEKNLSPKKIFEMACRELGYEGDLVG